MTRVVMSMGPVPEMFRIAQTSIRDGIQAVMAPRARAAQATCHRAGLRYISNISILTVSSAIAPATALATNCLVSNAPLSQQKPCHDLKTALPVVGALTVIALLVSPDVGLTVRRLGLVLATEAGIVATIAVLIAFMLRRTRAFSCLPIPQAVVGTILKSVVDCHIVIGPRLSTLVIVIAVIAVGITIVLIALVVSRLIGTAVALIVGLQAILVSAIIRAVGLSMAKALLVHEVVRIVLAVGPVVVLTLLCNGGLRRDETGDGDRKSKHPYCFSYIEFHLRLLIVLLRTLETALA